MDILAEFHHDSTSLDFPEIAGNFPFFELPLGYITGNVAGFFTGCMIEAEDLRTKLSFWTVWRPLEAVL